MSRPAESDIDFQIDRLFVEKYAIRACLESVEGVEQPDPFRAVQAESIPCSRERSAASGRLRAKINRDEDSSHFQLPLSAQCRFRRRRAGTAIPGTLLVLADGGGHDPGLACRGWSSIAF